MAPRRLVGALDQGTSSTRFLLFDGSTAAMVASHQIEVKQIFPKEGWVEQDPLEILESVRVCIAETVAKLEGLGLSTGMIQALGITNQRETTVVWDKRTGKPLHNAIVWLDARTTETLEILLRKADNNKDHLRSQCGLPLSTYFSALKLRWLLDNKPEVKTAVDNGNCLFGTVDTWLLWNLTGGPGSGKHFTDVTNASRTMLMNIKTLQWDTDLCRFFDIPLEILPEIHSSSEVYGNVCETSLKGTPISGILGDQQAALVGQNCLEPGTVKNTYGTGCFMLYNTGHQIVHSSHGLLTTVAYQLGPDKPAAYALEGSVANAGSSVQWLRDNVGIIKSSSEIETLARSVDSTHGCHFVPAFSGLFCPYWQPNARGLICGISHFTNKAHIARACLEAVCFQTREVLDAMNKDSGFPIGRLRVDGGMTVNSLLLQLQADLTGITVCRPEMQETTALGAAVAAGLADGVRAWSSDGSNSGATTNYKPTITTQDREQRFNQWSCAVKRVTLE